jgi:hypothetical protein
MNKNLQNQLCTTNTALLEKSLNSAQLVKFGNFIYSHGAEFQLDPISETTLS